MGRELLARRERRANSVRVRSSGVNHGVPERRERGEESKIRLFFVTTKRPHIPKCQFALIQIYIIDGLA